MIDNFTYRRAFEGDWEVIMQNHKGGRKAYLPRRICLCAHEDDAKCIAEAMELYENDKALPKSPLE